MRGIKRTAMLRDSVVILDPCDTMVTNTIDATGRRWVMSIGRLPPILLEVCNQGWLPIARRYQALTVALPGKTAIWIINLWLWYCHLG